ncbi:TPA: ABC transporter ATP-binding protein, partial [Enterococcus faecium]|nr:ABC transporter ATP-binding protein [Enterococcus faecium]
KHMSEKTLVIVAQRLSTIQQADNIIVLDEGKIVGQGTHEELLSNCQTYQEFAKSQGI